MERSKIHQNWTVSDLARLIYPPVQLGMVAHVTTSAGKLVGFGTVGLFSDEVSEGFRSGTLKLRFEDWKSGKIPWLVDVVAPFGHARLVTSLVRAKLRDSGYKGQYIHFRRNYGGEIRFSRAML